VKFTETHLGKVLPLGKSDFGNGLRTSGAAVNQWIKWACSLRHRVQMVKWWKKKKGVAVTVHPEDNLLYRNTLAGHRVWGAHDYFHQSLLHLSKPQVNYKRKKHQTTLFPKTTEFMGWWLQHMNPHHMYIIWSFSYSLFLILWKKTCILERVQDVQTAKKKE
jgi:hypothetical protein